MRNVTYYSTWKNEINMLVMILTSLRSLCKSSVVAKMRVENQLCVYKTLQCVEAIIRGRLSMYISADIYIKACVTSHKVIYEEDFPI